MNSEWIDCDDNLPFWQDSGKLVEQETPAGTIVGRLVVVDQTPGPDEIPLFAIEHEGVRTPFDCAKRWRFVE